ncbi:hypothetical protein B566_EDAN010393 [Ephemera danica]|nr:hypothetical protein B566_EDAN010393 [Ephemera danica]
MFKTLQRIHEAVKLDSLQPIHEYTNYSASVINVLTCFNQMKTDWQNIGWPDVKSSYIFLEKIIDNTRVCSEFYVERLKGKVNEVVLLSNSCTITPESCMLINNMEHLHRELRCHLDSLACNVAPDNAEPSGYELQKCVDNINEEIHWKYKEAMKYIVNLICTSLKQPLFNCVENNGIQNLDKFMTQLQTNLCVLTKHISETSMEQIVAEIWSELLAAVDIFVITGLEV